MFPIIIKHGAASYTIDYLSEPSIEMPGSAADAWLAALRSGEYTQGKERLHINGAYCCLGVMQMAVDGKVEKFVTNIGDAEIELSYSLPSVAWCAAHNISFEGASEVGGDGISYINPRIAKVICNDFPRENLLSEYKTASVINDSFELTFLQIADLLERAIKRI